MNETKPNYRVIIAGGRDFSDYELLKEKCDDFLKDKFLTHQVIVVSGMARGADALGLSQERRLKSSFLPAVLVELYAIVQSIGHLPCCGLAAQIGVGPVLCDAIALIVGQYDEVVVREVVLCAKNAAGENHVEEIIAEYVTRDVELREWELVVQHVFYERIAEQSDFRQLAPHSRLLRAI